MNRTYSHRPSEIEKRWWVVDAAGVPLGRLSSVVATLLTGKRKPTYAPHIDVGDFVVVVNARETVLTGRKEDQKMYYRHTNRPSSLKTQTARQVRSRYPERLVEFAVRGMLPKNRLGRKQVKKLKVYAGADHPHQAQQPEIFDLAQAV